ncbi:chromosome partition protein Smc-like [Maniola hyperantus]|uniref:chromosome partition protein Smc-like n=1 Tax=Aphantopus hyperantus TaxID=2795564 RepID=UPI00374896F6
MEEILNALKTIKMELDEQRLEIRETGKNVTEQVTINVNRMLEEKFLAWDEKHEKLKEIVENQQKRIYFLEKQSRNRNIVFFGIEETETSYEKLESNIIKWVEQYFSIELTYRDVQEVKRVGKKGERPRPLVVTFSTLGTKIKIWKQRNTLKDTHYYVKEDYPKYILEKRKELQEQLQLEREKGNIAVIKYDKLIITSKNNTKRKLPISPKNVTARKIDETIHTHKKNKIQITDTSIRRSNSISEGVVKPGILNFLVSKNTTNTTSSSSNQDKKT